MLFAIWRTCFFECVGPTPAPNWSQPGHQKFTTTSGQDLSRWQQISRAIICAALTSRKYLGAAVKSVTGGAHLLCGRLLSMSSRPPRSRLSRTSVPKDQDCSDPEYRGVAGYWTVEQLEEMDAKFCRRMRAAIKRGAEHAIITAVSTKPGTALPFIGYRLD